MELSGSKRSGLFYRRGSKPSGKYAPPPPPPPPPPLLAPLGRKEGMMGDRGGYDTTVNDVIDSSEVDRRAASFIAYVQERLKLERIEEDWRNY
ncbi:hypothetical protein BHE74_00031363 [Ensete ventricosum]|nr:hypothetical protein BHE74_00031363 [Ensete ventricosum]